MANLVISGDTSGSVTLSAPAVSGTTVLTLPTTSGTLVTTAGATALTTSGNLTFTGTGNRILGDFTNATVANRVMFQTSTANSATSIYILPSGTSPTSQFVASNNSDPTNASVFQIQANATETQLRSGITGTGTFLPLTMYTNGSERLRIGTNGHVGIGTSSPVDRLTVAVNDNSALPSCTLLNTNAGSSASCRLVLGVDNDVAAGLIYGSSTNSTFGANALAIYQNRAAPVTIWTNNTERMRIDSSGELLVGVTSIASGFSGFTQIEASGTSGGILINSTAGNICRLMFTKGNASGNEGLIRYDTSNYSMQFWTDGGERMRIASDGRILAGTTTSPGSALLACSSGSNYWQYGASTTGSSIFWVLNSGGTGVSLTSGNTSWAAQSDERTKDIIEPISDALNKVDSLRAVIGKYKTDEEGTRRSFLIAQDVQAVLPEVIDTDTDEQGTMSIRYTETIPLLVAAIKELNAKVTALEKQLGAK
jgi:hypothetical protein